MFLIDTYLDKSKIEGIGVFAKENVKKGEKIKEVRPEFEIEFDKENLLFCKNLYKNEKNFYKKKYHNNMLEYSDYLMYTKKKKLISSFDGFYGVNQKKKFKVVYQSIGCFLHTKKFYFSFSIIIISFFLYLNEITNI